MQEEIHKRLHAPGAKHRFEQKSLNFLRLAGGAEGKHFPPVVELTISMAICDVRLTRGGEDHLGCPHTRFFLRIGLLSRVRTLRWGILMASTPPRSRNRRNLVFCWCSAESFKRPRLFVLRPVIYQRTAQSSKTNTTFSMNLIRERANLRRPMQIVQRPRKLCDAYEHSTGGPGANPSWNSRNIRLVLRQKGE
jgi:hypothetical protein